MQTDEELMLEYREGKGAAFDELFRRYSPLLGRMLTRRVASPAIAEELVQQTFLHLHRGRHRYRVGSPLRPWVLTIALNLAREHQRRTLRWPLALSLDATVDLPDAPRHQQRFDASRDVSRVLGELPVEQRDAIALYWLHGLSFGEIAERVGTTAGAVRLRAHRGYAAMRRALGAA